MGSTRSYPAGGGETRKKKQENRTFLLSLTYLCEIGSHQIISPVEKPMTTSIWDEVLVILLTSWHKQWALVNKILVKYSA